MSGPGAGTALILLVAWLACGAAALIDPHPGLPWYSVHSEYPTIGDVDVWDAAGVAVVAANLVRGLLSPWSWMQAVALSLMVASLPLMGAYAAVYNLVALGVAGWAARAQLPGLPRGPASGTALAWLAAAGLCGCAALLSDARPDLGVALPLAWIVWLALEDPGGAALPGAGVRLAALALTPALAGGWLGWPYPMATLLLPVACAVLALGSLGWPRTAFLLATGLALTAALAAYQGEEHGARWLGPLICGCVSVAAGRAYLKLASPRAYGARLALQAAQEALACFSPLRWALEVGYRLRGQAYQPYLAQAVQRLLVQLDGPGPNFD